MTSTPDKQVLISKDLAPVKPEKEPGLLGEMTGSQTEARNVQYHPGAFHNDEK